MNWINIYSNFQFQFLTKIVFLELKKYNENLKNDYKKIRWLEFFGNKQYTSEPDDVLIQADNLLNLRNWSEEEKRMYDEVTRQQDHLWASLAYAQEEGMRMDIEQGHAAGREEGIEQRIEQGREEGRLHTINMIADLVKGGFLTKEIGAQKLNLSEKEFEGYL